MSTFKWVASLVLAATVVSALPAEPHCPGNVASVPLYLTNCHQMIVAVSVNSGYNFLLDTGTQITVIDPFFTAAFPQVPHPNSTEILRADIRRAAERNAGPEQMGMLWLVLAKKYHDRLELEKAEDAYAHAIHLLSDTSSQSDYAESLDGIGNVYGATGRFKEAQKCLTKSLDIYTTLNDEAKMAHLHLSLGINLIAEHKYRQAEMESSAALKGFEYESDADVHDVTMAYLTRSRAICAQGRCRSALDDVSQARSAAKNKVQENSIEMISIWLVQGHVQMQAGLQADGESAMNEALRLAQSRTDLPPPGFVALELTILRAQIITLKAAHRKQEAKYAEDQIKRIEADAPTSCTGCTVSASALIASGSR